MARISMTASVPAATESGDKDGKSNVSQHPGMQAGAHALGGLQIPAIGTIDDLRQEIADAFADMAEFHLKEPDEAMIICGAQSARLSEMRVILQRLEDFPQYRPLKAVRTRELEPCIDELKFQFQLASRLLSARQLDWEMSREPSGGKR